MEGIRDTRAMIDALHEALGPSRSEAVAESVRANAGKIGVGGLLTIAAGAELMNPVAAGAFEQISDDGKTLVLEVNSPYDTIGEARLMVERGRRPSVGQIAADSGKSDADLLFMGDRIVVVRTSEPGEQSADKTEKYKVVTGDSLDAIAHRNGTTWQRLYNFGKNRSIVGDNPNKIMPGIELDLPPDVESKAVRTVDVVVQSGDTLSAIVAPYGDNDDEAAKRSGIANKHLIRPGEVVTVEVRKAAKQHTQEVAQEVSSDLTSSETSGRPAITESAPEPLAVVEPVAMEVLAAQEVAPTPESAPAVEVVSRPAILEHDLMPVEVVSLDEARRLARLTGSERYGLRLETAEVMKYLYVAGFRGEDLVVMTAVTLGESGGHPFAVGDIDLHFKGDISTGLCQIYYSPGRGYVSPNRDPQANLNPLTAARNCFDMYAARGSKNHDARFNDWSAFKNGSHEKFIDEAWQAYRGLSEQYGDLAPEAITVPLRQPAEAEVQHAMVEAAAEIPEARFEGVDEVAAAYLESISTARPTLDEYLSFGQPTDRAWPAGVNTSLQGVFNTELKDKGAIKELQHLVVHWTAGNEQSGQSIANSLLSRKGNCCSVQAGIGRDGVVYGYTETPDTVTMHVRGRNSNGHSNNYTSIGVEIAAPGFPGTYELSDGGAWQGGADLEGFNAEQHKNAIMLYAWLVEHYGLTPDAIVGHEAIDHPDRGGSGKVDVPPQYVEIVRSEVARLLQEKQAAGTSQ